MKRREVITLLGGAAAWPVTAGAQEPSMPVVGFLGSLSQSAQSTWTAAFVQRMGEHGWIEGRTVAIEYRWAEGRGERFAEIAAEFVRLKVNVIVTAGTDAVIAVKKATSIIPIVFGTAGDPVANGLVANLARPGGNVTGLSNQSADIAGKRIELLRTVVPSLRRLAIMANIASSIGALEMREVQAAAHTLGLEVITLEIRRAEDIAPAIERLKGGADALYVVTEPLVNTNRVQINNLALGARLPTLHLLLDPCAEAVQLLQQVASFFHGAPARPVRGGILVPQDPGEPAHLRSVRALPQRALHGRPDRVVVLLVEESAELAGQGVRIRNRRVDDQRDCAVCVLVIAPHLNQVFGIALEVARVPQPSLPIARPHRLRRRLPSHAPPPASR